MFLSDWLIGHLPERLRASRNQRLQDHRRYSQMLRELSAHSDVALMDLGIMRCDIRRVAKEHARANR